VASVLAPLVEHVIDAASHLLLFGGGIERAQPPGRRGQGPGHCLPAFIALRLRRRHHGPLLRLVRCAGRLRLGPLGFVFSPNPAFTGGPLTYTLTVMDLGSRYTPYLGTLYPANTFTAYTGTVTFSSSNTAASLPSNYTYVSGDAGTHDFTFTLDTAGMQTITVAEASSTSLSPSKMGRAR
jgi:hypothetical protein